MHLVDGMEEEKVVLVASTKCLCDFPAIQQSQELWSALRDAAVKKVEGECSALAKTCRGHTPGSGCPHQIEQFACCPPLAC